MAAKVSLSVIILTKNEAGRIRECIESVRWADDVVVVDDESTDETVSVAEALGARVLRRKMDMEGRHRNWAQFQAKYEWVLNLDADERVTPELAQEIMRVVQNSAAFSVYDVPRRNYIGDRWIRHGGWYPSAQVKLFKKAVFHWEETGVHPRAFSDEPTGNLHHDIIHYTYRDLRDFIDKMNRQTTLEAQKWAADSRRINPVKIAWRMSDRFFRSYCLRHGYRDGFLGFVVAVMSGMYQFISYAKYWELTRVKGRS